MLATPWEPKPLPHPTSWHNDWKQHRANLAVALERERAPSSIKDWAGIYLEVPKKATEIAEWLCQPETRIKLYKLMAENYNQSGFPGIQSTWLTFSYNPLSAVLFGFSSPDLLSRPYFTSEPLPRTPPLSRPTMTDWEGLLSKLQDCVGLSIDMHRWIGASVKAVPGSGILVNQSGSVRLWLSVLRNQHPDRLKMLGAVLAHQEAETFQILELITQYGCNKFFDLPAYAPKPPSHPDPMELDCKPETIHPANSARAAQPLHLATYDDALLYLCDRLTADIRANTPAGNRRLGRVKSEMDNLKVLNYLRQLWPELLPEGVTIASMLRTVPNLAPWAAFLVHLGQLRTGINPISFELPIDLFAAMENAFAIVERSVGFVDLALYNTDALPQDRLAMFQEQVDDVMDVPTLRTIMGEKIDGRILSEEERAGLFQDFLDNVDKPNYLAMKRQALRHVYDQVVAGQLDWLVLNQDLIKERLFPKDDGAGAAPQKLSLRAKKGWAADTFAEIAAARNNPAILNAEVIRKFAAFDSNPEDLCEASPAIIEKLLAPYGEDFVAQLAVRTELKKRGFLSS